VLPGAATALTPAEEEFCEPRVLVDYTAPLDGLPKVREPPKSGRLPFGPRRLSFLAGSEPSPFAPDEMVVAGSGITYRLSLTGARYGKRLAWIVESRLVRVNGNGRGVRIAKRRSERVGFLRADSRVRPTPPRIVGFRRVDEPGVYRYDIIFSSRAGRRLGRFSDYYRVVRDNSETRLVLNNSSFRVGDHVLEKIENPGTEPLAYGAGPGRFERLEGSSWVSLEFEDLFGRPNVVPAIAMILAPGSASGCEFLGFEVPAGMTPGRYRVIKSEPEAERFLSAEFTVELG
jgi:hypothetical protein